jgi:hypothetical protein
VPSTAHAAYAATLQSVDGRVLWSAHGLTLRSFDGRKAVVPTIPSDVLHPGTFVISVSADQPGGETIEDFSFTVKRP